MCMKVIDITDHSVPGACKSGPKMDPKSANTKSFYFVFRWKKCKIENHKWSVSEVMDTFMYMLCAFMNSQVEHLSTHV